MLKEEASSTVVATKSLLLSRVIDAKEHCNAMILDASNTFTQYDMLDSMSGK